VVGVVAFVLEHDAGHTVMRADGEGSGHTVLTHDVGLSTSTGGFAVLSLMGIDQRGVDRFEMSVAGR
jgi:hypothetical protein